MSYRISPYKSIAEEIRDTLNEQNNKAIRSLNDMDISIDERIHDARKRFKKIRGAIRLAGYCIPKKSYSQMNQLYRDMGHKLAPLRDSWVKLKNLSQLLEEIQNGHEKSNYHSFFELLQVEYTKTKEEFRQKDIPAQVNEVLAKQSDKILELPVKNTAPEQVIKGMNKIYVQGKKANAVALKKQTPENLHEWRKRVKYLWYHTRLIRNIWKPVMKGYRNSLDDVSDYLGDRHDIDVLIYRLNQVFDLSNPAFSDFMEVVQHRKASLTEKAFRQGSKHYIEKPKAFSKRLLKYWELETEKA
ncbi:MAG: CHAD domain-containing protein [Bacteroidota bacterium]